MLTKEISLTAAEPDSIASPANRGWKVLLGFSFLFGMLLGTLGLLLSFLSVIRVVTNDIITGQTEAALIVAAFVLLIIGAHCADHLNHDRNL